VPTDRLPFDRPAGLRIFVPGWPQRLWGQNDRGLVLAGSFVISLAICVWSWGTWAAWGLFAFAFVAHVTSAVDALRQSSFPAWSSRTTLAMVSGVLGLSFYLPPALVLSRVAWPGFCMAGPERGYLVNCWAYCGSRPRQGDWIWLRLPFEQPRAGRVVAVPGQEVEWTGAAWRIDGHDRRVRGPSHLGGWPQTCRFRVPAAEVLVEPEDMGVSSPQAGSLVLVPSEAIVGRAWAQLYPVWDRHLL
jgi:hypothetical protein